MGDKVLEIYEAQIINAFYQLGRKLSAQDNASCAAEKVQKWTLVLGKVATLLGYAHFSQLLEPTVNGFTAGVMDETVKQIEPLGRDAVRVEFAKCFRELLDIEIKKATHGLRGQRIVGSEN